MKHSFLETMEMRQPTPETDLTTDKLRRAASAYTVRFFVTKCHVAAAMALFWIMLVCISPSSAQTCSADVQCANGGRPEVTCAGNTVIVRRSVCAGTCRTIEERRQDCGNSVTGGRCNFMTGSCDVPSGGASPGGRVPSLCAPSCTCEGRMLRFTRRSADGSCEPVVRRCKNGCSCDPRPQCR